MSDGERTAFAAVEAAVGAVFVVGGVLLVGVRGIGALVGAALVVLGAVAVAQSVAGGLGLMKLPERRGKRSDRE